ncbi:hypothetical protein CPC08DRAFT_277526 [Agrocybe pediades]|nr:hypothetical protein CPC08DRAFT_277526 [Agrocybe pediades]
MKNINKKIIHFTKCYHAAYYVFLCIVVICWSRRGISRRSRDSLSTNYRGSFRNSSGSKTTFRPLALLLTFLHRRSSKPCCILESPLNRPRE